MVRKPRAPAMSKEAMRQESERLVREAMARNVTITHGKTRLDVKCSKCGAPNRVSAEVDHGRVEYACKECGHKQKTLGPEDRWVFGHCGRDNVGREDIARPTCTKAACGRRSWMSSAGPGCVTQPGPIGEILAMAGRVRFLGYRGQLFDSVNFASRAEF